jgi:nitroreductase
MDRAALLDAIANRHAVRKYTDEPVSSEVRQALTDLTEAESATGGLHMQLMWDEPEAFSTLRARYGRFTGVDHYLALIGPKSPTLEQRCGYHGERVVLKAQRLGLNSCWVQLNFSRKHSPAQIGPDERFVIAVALGHGATNGKPHKARPAEQFGHWDSDDPFPDWFTDGLRAVQQAPSGVNQQTYRFRLEPNPQARDESDTEWIVRPTPGHAFCAQVDLGIAQQHFEIGAHGGPWRWADET